MELLLACSDATWPLAMLPSLVSAMYLLHVFWGCAKTSSLHAFWTTAWFLRQLIHKHVASLGLHAPKKSNWSEENPSSLKSILKYNFAALEIISCCLTSNQITLPWTYTAPGWTAGVARSRLWLNQSCKISIYFNRVSQLLMAQSSYQAFQNASTKRQRDPKERSQQPLTRDATVFF